MQPQEVYIEVGKSIELTQLCDKIFKMVLLGALPQSEQHGIDAFLKNKATLERATLGRLIRILQDRVQLESSFEETLESYLSSRNKIVHDWDEIPEWEDPEVTLAYLTQFQKKAAWLICCLLGILREWMHQTGITHIDEKHPEIAEFLAEVDLKWKNHTHTILEQIK